MPRLRGVLPLRERVTVVTDLVFNISSRRYGLATAAYCRKKTFWAEQFLLLKRFGTHCHFRFLNNSKLILYNKVISLQLKEEKSYLKSAVHQYLLRWFCAKCFRQTLIFLLMEEYRDELDKTGSSLCWTLYFAMGEIKKRETSKSYIYKLYYYLFWTSLCRLILPGIAWYAPEALDKALIQRLCFS